MFYKSILGFSDWMAPYIRFQEAHASLYLSESQHTPGPIFSDRVVDLQGLFCLVLLLLLLSSSCLSPSSLSPIHLNHAKMEQFYIYLPFKLLISPSVYRIIDWFKWLHMVLTKIYWNYKFVFSNVTYISIVTFCHCVSIYKCAVRYVYHGIYMVQAHYEASTFHTILVNKPRIITVFQFSLSHIYIITPKRRVSICQFGIKWCYQNNVTMIMIIFLAIT